MKVKPLKQASKPIWSLELGLVIGLPLIAVIACLFSLYLALKHPAHESHPIDRFGHVVPAEQ